VDLWGLETRTVYDGSELRAVELPPRAQPNVNNVYMQYMKNASDTLNLTVIPTAHRAGVDYNSIVTKSYAATNNVRTPEQRNNVPVKFTSYYYFPEQFPSGTWAVDASVETEPPKDVPLFGPTKIPTKATRVVP